MVMAPQSDISSPPMAAKPANSSSRTVAARLPAVAVFVLCAKMARLERVSSPGHLDTQMPFPAVSEAPSARTRFTSPSTMMRASTVTAPVTTYQPVTRSVPPA